MGYLLSHSSKRGKQEGLGGAACLPWLCREPPDLPKVRVPGPGLPSPRWASQFILLTKPTDRGICRP